MIHIRLQGSQQNPPHGASSNTAVQASLSGKMELTTCNAFAGLTHDPSTTFQSFTGAHTRRTAATRYHMLCGGPWCPPSIVPSGSPTCWVSFQLC